MRYVKIISMALAIAAVTAAAMADQGSNVGNRFGKGPTTAGLTPGGGNYYSPGNVYYAPAPVIATAPKVTPAPVVASVPATTGRRSFSAEPAAPQSNRAGRG